MEHARAAGIRLLAAFAAGFLLTGPAHAAGGFLDQRQGRTVTGDAAAGQEKSLVCRACHGQQGHSAVPSFPKLGGQNAEYLYWEMVKYKTGVRLQSPMTEQMAPMSDQDLMDIALFFAAQPPAGNTTPGGDREAARRADTLYHQGDAEAGIPPCQGCHGVDGRGVPGRGDWPVLRGQHAEYTAMRLRAYRDGQAPRASNDFIMEAVARNLDDASIEALAAWLDALPARP